METPNNTSPSLFERIRSHRLTTTFVLLATLSVGILAGSVLDMASAVRNCVQLLDLPLADALRLASASPAAFLGVDSWLAHLAPGYRADMVALDPDTVRTLATWVAGTPSPTA